MGFSYLNERRFWQNFVDTVNTMYDCGSEIESTQHFPLDRPFFKWWKKKTLWRSSWHKTIYFRISKRLLTNILLFDSYKFEETINWKILQSTITYLKSYSRFERPLIDKWRPFCFFERRRENTDILFGFLRFAFFTYM